MCSALCTAVHVCKGEVCQEKGTSCPFSVWMDLNVGAPSAKWPHVWRCRERAASLRGQSSVARAPCHLQCGGLCCCVVIVWPYYGVAVHELAVVVPPSVALTRTASGMLHTEPHRVECVAATAAAAVAVHHQAMHHH